MSVQVLVSTMNQKDYSLLEQMRIETDAVVVNQCDRDGENTIDYNGHKVVWIDSTTRGLSVSRNICLNHAWGDICLLADDDICYVNGYEKIVEDAFSRNQGYSFIRFKAKGIEKLFKRYPNHAQRVRFLRSMKMSSVEIALKRKDVGDIRFDEAIGAGTEFYMGEENVFLAECLRRKLKIFYEPIELLQLHIGNSSWFKGMNEQFFISRGASFAAMKTGMTDLLILQFAVRKHSRYKKEMSFFRAMKLMRSGKKQYVQLKKRTV